MTLSLTGDIPAPTTAVTPMARSGVPEYPRTTFNYEPVGVTVEMTPWVTVDNQLLLDLSVEHSTLGGSIDVAGTSLPTFGARRVVTPLRLHDGESSLLAGLLREQDREALRGLPWLRGVPLLRSLLGDTAEAIHQTDIVMLLTPRIVRTHELTPRDIDPIPIEARTTLALREPPVLTAEPGPDTDPATPAAAPPPNDPAPLAEPARLRLTRWLSDREPARLRLTRWLPPRTFPLEQPAGAGTEAVTGLAFSHTLLDEPAP